MPPGVRRPAAGELNTASCSRPSRAAGGISSGNFRSIPLLSDRTGGRRRLGEGEHDRPATTDPGQSPGGGRCPLTYAGASLFGGLAAAWLGLNVARVVPALPARGDLGR
jgi:hypothetical protein